MPSRGEVVYVPFHFTDRAVSKVRPAVVISTDDYHASRDDVIIMGITTNLNRREFVGYVILEDWQSSGLRDQSAVSGIIMTVRSREIVRTIGRLSARDLSLTDKALAHSIGI
jgi:mRNA interferase MazF